MIIIAKNNLAVYPNALVNRVDCSRFILKKTGLLMVLNPI